MVIVRTRLKIGKEDCDRQRKRQQISKISDKRPATFLYWLAEDMIMDEVNDGGVEEDEFGNKG